MGAGLGGFIDGIVFHQILQWHNMLSGWIAPDDIVAIKVNMVWDGYFHLAVWLMTVAGLGILLRGVSRAKAHFPVRSCAGALPLGWGVFNVLEGIIDHHVLGVHRVNAGSEFALAWDVGFVILGVALIAAGVRIRRKKPA